MQKVVLTFKSFMEFLDFQLHVQSRDYKINKKHLMLIGTFLDKEIQLATHQYAARALLAWNEN